jgi:hypothetical protein
MQRPQRREKDLLGGIFRLVTVAQQREADRANAAPVLLVEALELVSDFAVAIPRWRPCAYQANTRCCRLRIL